MPSNLTCPRAACHGEFEFLGDQAGSALYRCEECGEELEQTDELDEIADGDGPAAELVRALLGGDGR